MAEVFQFAVLEQSANPIPIDRREFYSDSPLINVANVLLSLVDPSLQLKRFEVLHYAFADISARNVQTLLTSPAANQRYVILGSLGYKDFRDYASGKLEYVDILADGTSVTYLPIHEWLEGWSHLEHFLSVAPNVHLRANLGKAMRCKAWITNLQAVLSHGDKNRLLVDDTGAWDGLVSQLSMPQCGWPDSCGVSSTIDASNKYRSYREISNKRCPNASLCNVIPTGGGSTQARFRRAFIIENNSEVMEHVAQLARSQAESVYLVDHSTSLKKGVLHVRSHGDPDKPFNQMDWGQFGRGDLFTIDLDLGVEPRTFGLRTDGLRLAYQISMRAPLATRVIVTAEPEMANGTTICINNVVLEKPFSPAEFDAAVSAAATEKVVWICPSDVRAHWENLADSCKSFNDVLSIIERSLSQERITVLGVDSAESSLVSEASVVILDMIPQPPTVQKKPVHQLDQLLIAYQQVRLKNPSTQVVLILPGQDRSPSHNGITQQLRKSIRPLHDRVIEKPMPIGSAAKNSLESVLIETISSREHFDVKYRVVIPLAALIVPSALDELSDAEATISKNSFRELIRYSPLALLASERLGFSFAVSAFAEVPSLHSFLEAQLNQLAGYGKLWSRYMSSFNDKTKKELVTDFFTFAKENSICRDYPTIESWLRTVLNGEQVVERATLSMSLRHLTVELNSLFGGESRIEFASRGGWYDASSVLVEDSSLLVEFCGRRSSLAREAIKSTIGEYLKQVGMEDVVLVTEEPLSGFLL